MVTPRPAPPRVRPTAAGRRSPAAVAALTLALLPLLSGPASAHTALSGSSPAEGASLDGVPEQVELVFTEPVAPDLATVVVTGPDGAAVPGGDAAVEGDTVTRKLQDAAAAGDYQVAYRVVAADGHPVTGTVTFSVTGSPASAAPGPAADEPVDPAPAEAAAESAASVEEPASDESAPDEPVEAPAAAPATESTGASSDAGWLVPAAVVVVLAGVAAAALLARRRPRA